MFKCLGGHDIPIGLFFKHAHPIFMVKLCILYYTIQIFGIFEYTWRTFFESLTFIVTHQDYPVTIQTSDYQLGTSLFNF